MIAEELNKKKANIEASAAPPASSIPSSTLNPKSGGSSQATDSEATLISETERLSIERQLILDEEEEGKKKEEYIKLNEINKHLEKELAKKQRRNAQTRGREEEQRRSDEVALEVSRIRVGRPLLHFRGLSLIESAP
jgi:hypothetical protein